MENNPDDIEKRTDPRIRLSNLRSNSKIGTYGHVGFRPASESQVKFITHLFKHRSIDDPYRQVLITKLLIGKVSVYLAGRIIDWEQTRIVLNSDSEFSDLFGREKCPYNPEIMNSVLAQRVYACPICDCPTTPGFPHSVHLDDRCKWVTRGQGL